MLANELDAQGHSVAVIDIKPSAFSRLSPDFSGQRVHGNGFDQGVLKKAHIQDAYGFAAVSNGDNSNVIATRTAAEQFGVGRFVARIADPERAELYERLGIPTVASTRRTAMAVLERMVPPNANVVWTGPTGAVSLVAISPGLSWTGVPFSRVEKLSGGRIAFVSRLSTVQVAKPSMVVQEHDKLYIGVSGRSATDLRDLLTSAPPQEGDAQ